MGVRIKYAQYPETQSLVKAPEIVIEQQQAAAVAVEATASAVQEVQAFKQALSKSDLPVLPWEDPEEHYTILDALKEFAEGRGQSKTLVLVAKTGKSTYVVKAFDPETNRAVLEGSHGMTIKPVVGEREIPLYKPFWR